MKADRNNSKVKENGFVKQWIEKWERESFRKYAIDGFSYLFPPLVSRPRCFTFNPKEGCLYCGNKTFRYFSKVAGKKYYQCEKCGGINH